MSNLGDSIATNGICLTVIELTGQGFAADVSNETLRRTCLKTWKVGTAVNLEKALNANQSFRWPYCEWSC
jgi:riboflavin synthase